MSIAGIVNLVLGGALAVAVAWLLRAGNPASNLRAMETWFNALDVVVDGQRYRGTRATAVATLVYARHGLGGLRVESLFRTTSGRVFRLRLTSQFGRVIEWQLVPEDPAVLKRIEDGPQAWISA